MLASSVADLATKIDPHRSIVDHRQKDFGKLAANAVAGFLIKMVMVVNSSDFT